jgi:hypothetical protein
MSNEAGSSSGGEQTQCSKSSGAPGFDRKDPSMEFFTSWTFMGIMAVLLVALIGLLIYLRSKGQGDED